MKTTLRLIAVTVLWTASLLGVALWAQGQGANANQGGRETAPMRVLQQGEPTGEVITGADLGFQPTVNLNSDGRSVTGYLVVKVNGQWRRTTQGMQMVR